MLLPHFKRIVSTNNMYAYICALAKVTSYIADVFESVDVNASGYAEFDDVVHLARYLAGRNDVELN